MNWQLIETAPKDRRVLLYFPPPLYNRGHVTTGRWDDDRQAKKPAPYWLADDYSVIGRVYLRKHFPTHWCELVAPGN